MVCSCFLDSPFSTLFNACGFWMIQKESWFFSFPNPDLLSSTDSFPHGMMVKQLSPHPLCGADRESIIAEGWHDNQTMKEIRSSSLMYSELLGAEKPQIEGLSAVVLSTIQEPADDLDSTHFHGKNMSVQSKVETGSQKLYNHSMNEGNYDHALSSQTEHAADYARGLYGELRASSQAHAGVCEESKQSYDELCTPRPRWCPTPEQIQLLESLFNSGTTTPSREMIVEIAGQLRKYGNIAEANVFYWFQNRKARTKRKLLNMTEDGPLLQGRNRVRKLSHKTSCASSSLQSEPSQSRSTQKSSSMQPDPAVTSTPCDHCMDKGLTSILNPQETICSMLGNNQNWLQQSLLNPHDNHILVHRRNSYSSFLQDHNKNMQLQFGIGLRNKPYVDVLDARVTLPLSLGNTRENESSGVAVPGIHLCRQDNDLLISAESALLNAGDNFRPSQTNLASATEHMIARIEDAQPFRPRIYDSPLVLLANGETSSVCSPRLGKSINKAVFD